MSWVGSSRAKYEALRSRKTSIDLCGARNSSLRKSASRCIFFVPPSPERLVELDAHAVRRPVADVLDDEEEQAAVEDDVEDHLGVAALVLHGASLRG